MAGAGLRAGQAGRARAEASRVPAEYSNSVQLSNRGFDLTASGRKAARLVPSPALFALPTLLWVGLLRPQGTVYYNQEATRYQQLAWLLDAPHWSPLRFLALVAAQLGAYARSWKRLTLWMLPAPPTGALTWVAGSGGLFFGLLSYYPPRLAYALLPRWPRRWAQPLAWVVAAGWYLWTLFSYGPFSWGSCFLFKDKQVTRLFSTIS